MYKLILAIRYLIKRRVTYLAVLAVALCVFIVVVVMTVLTGLVRDFTAKNYEFAGDCVISSESLVGFAYYEDFVEMLRQSDAVAAASPVVHSYGLISPTAFDQNIGVEIMGIDPVRHSAVTGFEDTLHYTDAGELEELFEPPYDANMAGCVLGIDLAMTRDNKGDYKFTPYVRRIDLAVTTFPLTARGVVARGGIANTKTFQYCDVSRSGLARVDSVMIYLPFEQAQLMCMSGRDKRVNAIHVKLAAGVGLQKGCNRLRAMWTEYTQTKADAPLANLFETVRVETWKENRRAYIAAMEKEQTMMSALFVLVGFTAVFIVFVVFYMIVSHKTKDIGILKSVGVSNWNVVGLFLGFAAMVGLVGSVIGITAGWLFCSRMNRLEAWLLEQYGFQLWDRSIYAIGDIPSKVDPEVLAVIMFAAVGACILGALMPSWRAARLRPVETLKVSQM